MRYLGLWKSIDNNNIKLNRVCTYSKIIHNSGPGHWGSSKAYRKSLGTAAVDYTSCSIILLYLGRRMVCETNKL